MVDIDEDSFFCILAHIPDSKTIYLILIALPKSHLLFPVTLARLWQLPIYLDSYNHRAATASQKVLDYLLDDDADTGGLRPLAESIRHLVVSMEHLALDRDRTTTSAGNSRGNHARGRRQRVRFPSGHRLVGPDFSIPRRVQALQERLPELFRRTVNLESLDYHNLPGIDMKSTHAAPLQHLEKLRSFAVDCALRNRNHDIPAGIAPSAAPGGLSAQYDAEICEIEPLLLAAGPSIASLELRHVNRTMFTILAGQSEVFASYHALEHLKIDITEGVWDWDGAGSPQMGPSSSFQFPRLVFPAVKRFELVVCDATLHHVKTGPLDLVHSRLLRELSLDVRYSLGWYSYETISLFEALSPLDFPALARLEIKDNSRNTARHYWLPADNHLRWEDKGRTYHGFVPVFLRSILTGSLVHLTSLWVDEQILISPNIPVQDLLDGKSEESKNVLWRETLRATFGQLESLRVGFGAITHIEASLILGLCDPTKLTQFGFEWNWWHYGPDEPISAELLGCLSQFPKLTDVHILFPRPETWQLSGLPNLVDARTLSDVISIFRSNETICRIGIGNSMVWERHPSAEPSRLLLVSDGSAAPNPGVPKFFHAGFLFSEDPSDNAIPPRPVRGEEIEQLRDLLQRIVT
ncbi:hypothetical protein C8R44DRAFT_822601 [Mycena epipterygia]|nr:hypothetical protein C8R44DRAFT_822601 [Mycena epipterygia]